MTEIELQTGTPDVVAIVHRLYKEARDHSSQWRVEAQEAYDMAAGQQWDERDVAAMRDQNRVPVTFNRISRVINSVIGTQVANRQETRFLPREIGDSAVNEVLTGAAEWVRDETDAEDEESDAFADMAICGMGWTETRMDYEVEPDGKICIDRVDPLEMYWDPGSTKRNLADAKWIMRIKRLSMTEFEQAWPDAAVDTQGAPFDEGFDEIGHRVHVYAQDAYKEQQALASGPKGRRRIMVAQFQWAEPETVYRIGPKAMPIGAEQFSRISGKLEASGIEHVKQHRIRWRQAFVAGSSLLEEGNCPFADGPTFRAMTYMRDRNKGVWYGLVRVMLDPQRWGNKFFSLILDILVKGAKGGVLIESDATDDLRKLEETWARPDAIHTLRPGAISQGKLMPKPLATWPAGLDKLMSFSLEAVHEVSGVNVELLGLADRAQPGILEMTRKQAGLTILAPLFDSLRRYRKEQGRVLLHFIQTYISDGRLIRVVGGDGKERYVPLAKRPETAKYDVIVDEAPTSPNMKERVFAALVQMMPALAKMGVPLPPELLDYAPIPSALASRWKEMIGQSGGDPNALRGQMDQMAREMQRLAGENQALKAKREEAAAELRLSAEKQAAENALAVQKLRQQYEIGYAELVHKTRLAEMELGAKVALDAQRAVQPRKMGRSNAT